MILCVVLITAITVMFVAGQELMMSSVRSQQRYEQRIQANYILESVANFAASEFQAKLYSPTSKRTATILGKEAIAQVSDNDSKVAKTLQMECSVSIKGSTYTSTLIRGKGDVSPWNYALFVNNGPGSDWSNPYGTGSLGSNGDAYIGKSATTAVATVTIQGDVESDGAITRAQFPATGTTWESAPQIPPVTAPLLAYATAGFKVVIPPMSNIDGYNFPAEAAGVYQMLYKVGDLTVTGNFTGSGLIVATGSVTLYGPASVSGGKIAVIAGGEIRLRGITPINAYVFAPTVYHQDKGSTLNGAIVCDVMGSNKVDCKVIYDPYLWNNPAERAKLRLPYHWP